MCRTKLLNKNKGQYFTYQWQDVMFAKNLPWVQVYLHFKM